MKKIINKTVNQLKEKIPYKKTTIIDTEESYMERIKRVEEEALDEIEREKFIKEFVKNKKLLAITVGVTSIAAFSIIKPFLKIRG